MFAWGKSIHTLHPTPRRRCWNQTHTPVAATRCTSQHLQATLPHMDACVVLCHARSQPGSEEVASGLGKHSGWQLVSTATAPGGEGADTHVQLQELLGQVGSENRCGTYARVHS